MKNRPAHGLRSTSACALLLSVLWFGWPGTGFAELQIERAQRNFQARYFFLTSNYVSWPPCSCGRAPHFPKDGFYGDISQNPVLGVELVRDLVDKFFGTYLPVGGNPRPFSESFIQTGEEGVEVESLTELPRCSFTPIEPAQVNTSNYAQTLTVLESYLSQLQYVLIDSAGEGLGVNGAIDAVIQGVSWEKQTPDDYQWLTADSCTEYVEDWYSQFDEAPTNQGSRIRILAATWGMTNQCTVIWYEEWWLKLLSAPGGIKVDLKAPRYVGGTGKVFLKVDGLVSGRLKWVCLGPDPEDPAFLPVRVENNDNPQPPVLPSDLYRRWEGIVVEGGTDWQRDVLSDQRPTFPEECGTGYGWEVVDQYILFKPQWSSAPEDFECGSCKCLPGTVTTHAGSAAVKIEMGASAYGDSAGFLYYYQPTLNDAHATLPPRLQHALDPRRGMVWTNLDTTGNLAWAYVPSTRILLKTTRDDLQQCFTNKFYTNATLNLQGQPEAAEPPFKTVILGRVGEAGVEVTEISGCETKVSQFVWSATDHPLGKWELIQGGGLRKEVVINTTLTTTQRFETFKILGPDDLLVYEELRQFERFPWGEELVWCRVDPQAAELDTFWTYCTDTNSTAYGRLLEMADPTVGWERYQYDQYGRTTNILKAFKNSLPGQTDSQTQIWYAPGSASYTVVKYLYGHPISERKVATTMDPADYPTWAEIQEVQYAAFAEPGGAVSTGSQTTITKICVDPWRMNPSPPVGQDATNLHARPLIVQRPDGTMEFYQYDPLSLTSPLSGPETTTVYAGEPNPERTAIRHGTKTLTTLNVTGNVLARQAWYVTNGTEILTASETSVNPDNYGRPQKIVNNLDGTYIETVYGCCDVHSFRDRDGLVTEYGYDALRRQVTAHQVNFNITTKHYFDAAGNLTGLSRIDSNGVEVLQQQALYDHAGKMYWQWNVRDGSTTINHYYPNPNTRTTTYANGGTRVETYFKDGQLASVNGTAANPLTYDYGWFADGPFTKETKGPGTTEWTLSYQDFLGRPYKQVFAAAAPPFPFAQSLYNDKGQQVRQIDLDGVSTVQEYDGRGELEYTVVDMNRNGAKDPVTPGAPDDRITRTVSAVVTSHPTYQADVHVTDTYVWPNEDQDSPVRVATQAVSLDGLTSWETTWDNGTPVTTRTQTEYGVPSAAEKTVTRFAPDGSRTVNVYYCGRLTSTTLRDSQDQPVTSTTHTYDAQGRLWKVTDSRNGTTVYAYNNADQTVAVTTPAPGTGEPSQVTQTQYDLMGRTTNVLQPDGTATAYAYTLRGELAQHWGSRAYPVGYRYDDQGRLLTMTNWSSFAALGGGRTTTWSYHPYRGWLGAKRDAHNLGPNYTYTEAGRLRTRLSARATTTTYGTNAAGELSSLSYNDGVTPSVSYTYDRHGRRTGATVGTTSTASLAYNQAGELLKEEFTAGILAGLSVTNGYDASLRHASVYALRSSPASVLGSYTLGYDHVSRLQSVTAGSRSATYGYLANSPLVSQITFKNGTDVRLTTTKQHDYLNRLLQTASAPSASGELPVAFGYGHNPANQRLRTTLGDGSYWLYRYDALGQVISGKRYWSDHTPVAGQQFEYAFDDIGNRTQTKAGGDASGGSLRTASYTADAANMYGERAVPGAVDILGLAAAAATVTVNGDANVYRRSEYYHRTVSVDNTNAGAVLAPITVTATLAGYAPQTQAGDYFLPSAAEYYYHDEDGNTWADGRWVYTWDAENRLIEAEMWVAVPETALRRLAFAYDDRGRRIRKQVYAWATDHWQLITEHRFLYDGWNLVGILDAQSTLLQSFAWGTDLSGTLTGAGGVGGLLSMTDYQQGTAGTYFYAYDGNGNVAGLVNAADGKVAAAYEYGPFGEVIRASGPLAQVNPFRFSTKYQDEETGFLYYGYRYYNPSTGRWLNRDPIGENGGLHLYGFVLNNPVSRFDIRGLSVDPSSIVGPDIAVGISRLGPTLVNSLLFNNARNPMFPYETVRKKGMPLALLAHFAFNNPGFRGNGVNRFVFTCKCGWIDNGHFWASALGGHGLGADTSFLLGVFVEEVQGIKYWPDGWRNSTYTAEDLPSDLLGSVFGQSLRGRDYALIPRLLERLLKDCGAIDPARLSPEQWKLLRQEAIEWERDLVQAHDAYPKRAKACTALCPGKKQSQDDDFTRILQNLSR